MRTSLALLVGDCICQIPVAAVCLFVRYLICLLLCSRRALERGFLPQPLRNYHTGMENHIRLACLMFAITCYKMYLSHTM